MRVVQSLFAHPTLADILAAIAPPDPTCLPVVPDDLPAATEDSAPVMKSADALQRFQNSRMARGMSPRTIEGYRYRLGRFVKECPDLPMEPEPIEAFLAKCGPSDETRRTYWKLLHAFYRWLHKRKAISENPMDAIEAPIVRRKVARSLTVDELTRFLTDKTLTPHVKAIVFLLIDTGIRLGEAMSLTPNDLRDDSVVVMGKVGQREVPCTPAVVAMVRHALPWPWATTQTASKAIRKARQRAGITGAHASAQALRHTFVRLWEGDPYLLVDMLGWTSPRMLKVYRPYDFLRASQQHQQFSPLNKLTRKRK